MNQQTNIFLQIAGQTGDLAGEWFAVPQRDNAAITIAISLQSGTTTWTVQGRNTPADDALDLDTGSADEAITVPRFNQMRVILTSAADATFIATGDRQMREVEAL